jgi:hypothetical protein
MVYRALSDPSVLLTLAPGQLDHLFRRARRAGVLSRLAVSSQACVPDGELSAKARDYLVAARLVAAHHQRTVHWEVNRIRHALKPVGVRIVLLKGAAYTIAKLPAREGRLASDIDFMVPKAELGPVESALDAAGWKTMKLDPYDQRYYRTWMHELPPMRHETRDTVLDVHHTILPESSRYHPDPVKLLEAAVDLDDDLAVLAPEDMVLHSATHLFADGDLAGGLRELLDLDALFRHFGDSDPGFWERLAPRAVELDLQRPLFYAVCFCRKLLGTPIPEQAVIASHRGSPSRPSVWLMSSLAERAILPDLDGRWTTDAALWLLYVRSHWMRMPPLLLGQHLIRKAWHRWLGRDDSRRA